MARDYRAIKNRYENLMIDIPEDEMFKDIQAMIAYIEVLHTVIARQAQAKVVEDTIRIFEDEKIPGMKYPH